MINVNDNKEKFISIVKENIHRDGIDDLMNWLACSDFYFAPASTKFHGNEPGGLCQHVLKVYECLKKKQENESDETIAIAALFHDLCKVNLYKKHTYTRKDGVVKISYTAEDDFPVGHGEKSVILLMQYMKLSVDEILAIRHHMGAYNLSSQDLVHFNNALQKSRLVLKLHTADSESSFWYNE